MHTMEEAKKYWSTNHLQSPRVVPRGDQEHRYEIAEYVLGMRPKSVLEFGCSSGRNLAVMRELDSKVHLEGVDMAKIPVRNGAIFHPTIKYNLGDETFLNKLPDGAFDVVFTCSVLDHIPDWKPVYAELKRVAASHLILIEPILEEGGSIFEGDLNPKIDTVPYTYSWDYEKNDPDLKRIHALPITTIPGTLGPLYWLFDLKKETKRG